MLSYFVVLRGLPRAFSRFFRLFVAYTSALHALFAVPPLRLVMGFTRRFCAPLFVRPLRAFFVLLALGKAIVA